MKCLRIYCAIVRIFFNFTIVYLEKKIYFCQKNKIFMLQRIQTIYLLIAMITTIVLPFLFPLWTQNDGKKFYFMLDSKYVILFGLSSTLSLLSIISFKKRQNQFVIGRLNIILNLILLGLFVYRFLNLSGEAFQASEKDIGMFLPIVAIVFLVLANKSIKKDEDLVKSVDRLR